MTIEDLYNLLNTGGALALLLIFLYGGWKSSPWWVYGREFRKLEREKEYWQELALRGLGTVEKAVDTIARDHSS